MAIGLLIGNSGIAVKAEPVNAAPFEWEPQYSTTCQLNGKDYPCRVIPDGQEFYANVPERGLFHFSLISEPRPCGNKEERADCGFLRMSQPNNERDIINFSYKKSARGWSLNQINNALGGPNEHLKLSIASPQNQEPKCTYNGKHLSCIILPLPSQGGCELSEECHQGFGFEMIPMQEFRGLGKGNYDTLLYQVKGPSKPCGLNKECQSGTLEILTTYLGYLKKTQATYRTTKKQWLINSFPGNTMTIDIP